MSTRDSILKSLQQGFDHIQGINKSEARSSKTSSSITEAVNISLVTEDGHDEDEDE